MRVAPIGLYLPDNENMRMPQDEFEKAFIEYKFRHILKVVFDSDNNRLGKILFGLVHCPQHPEFRISYTVKDTEAAKNELLARR